MTDGVQQSLEFEGFEIETFRASLAAVALPLEEPLKYRSKVRVVVEAEVEEIQLKGWPLVRIHKLKPSHASIEVL